MNILKYGLTKPKQPRVYYDINEGWCVEADFSLNPAQLRACAKFALKINEDRWRSLPPGDKKDELGKLLRDLREKGVQQMVRNKKSFEIGFD